MEEDLIIKKIYINDYIINTTLLQNSISRLLINTLSSKFYKTNRINQKVNNILTKIDNIFIEDSSGNKIFNLSYQPYNQYNITNNYTHNSYNKKWILPIITEKKTLSHNVLKVQFMDYYNTLDLLLDKQEDDTYKYQESIFDINSNENHFEDENTIVYKKQYVNLLGNIERVEVPYLSHTNNIYNINDPNNINTSILPTKVIRSCEDKCYSISSLNTSIGPSEKNSKIIDKNIDETYYEVHNILANDAINIKQFLILNPLKLLHTNYNITLGNTISYLNEIMNATFLNIDNIINTYENNLDTIEFRDKNDLIIDHTIINKDEMSNQYNNNDGYIYDYLNIIKNLDNYDNIYSIRILKHIYNIFGYDLNKVPHCYIVYLQNILHNNINKYINTNTKLHIYLTNTFKSYVSNINNTSNTNPNIEYISELYNISNISYNPNESLYSILYNNTHDKGLLYYLNLYNENYLKTKTTNKFKLIPLEEDTNIDCNYRIVKKYDNLEDFTNDTNKYVDLEFSLDNYLVEYEDLVYNLQRDNSDEYIFKNTVYKQNIINSNKKISIIANDEVAQFIENKMYMYELLFEKLDVNTNILFSKLMLLKYKNKRYVQIPYKVIENDNIVLIDNVPYTHNDNELKSLNMDLDTLHKEIINKCINPNVIARNNINNVNNFYKKLNNIDISDHKKNILDLVDILKADNKFKNFLLQKSKSFIESNIYFKNIEKVTYILNNYNQANFTDYLLKYNIKSIKQANLKETDLLDEVSNSIFNTTYIKQIKIISDKIDQTPLKYLWNYIHHYINEYELLTNVIEDGDKYNRAYYKLWELLLDNKIIDKPDFKLISLAESPGNFVKCVQNLKNTSWNNFIICTLLDDNDTINQGNFFNTYKDYIFGNPNGKLKINDDANKDFNGNLTNSKDIITFVNYIKTNNLQADLITADGGIKKTTNIDYLLEEYNHLPLFLGEIITALYTQNVGGMFILKMYDIVSINSVHLINLLSAFYSTINITKPYNSRPCNTEKYIICSDFKGFNTTNSNQEKILTNLLSILDNLQNNVSEKMTSYKYFNIFENLPVNEENNSKIIEFNNSIIVKTQLLHLQDIYDIIMKNDEKQLRLIKTYFGSKRNHNIKNVLTSEENTDKGYFIKKIENCITLALYMKLKNQPLKTEYIEYYRLIKNMKKSSENTNIYPPHFKEIYEINREENKSIRVDKINKFVKKYCIVFDKPGVHKIIDYNILRTVEYFILNKHISNINHNIINIIRENKTDLNKLYKYLEEICKITDIKKLFYLQNSNVISLIKNFQNTIRTYLGYYLCKYTYIPIYPKYKTLDNVIDQVEQYGILYNSHYICYYSGDKLDMEEFDDFMGDNIFRSNNMSLFDEQSCINNTITNISTTYNTDLTIEQNICSYILNKFKFDNTLKLNIINKLQYNTTLVLNEYLNNVEENYSAFVYLLNKKYDKSLIKTDKTKNTYVYNSNKYNYFKLDTDDLTTNNITINSKITNIIKDLITNKDNITIDKKLDDRHLLIRNLHDLLLSKYFYSKYTNTIIYTLVQIVNNTTFEFTNIYDVYVKFEKFLMEYVYKNSSEFDIFKNKLLTNYILPINLPDFTTEKTLDDIFTLNNNEVIDILKNHIKIDKNNWNPHKLWKSIQTKNKKSYDEKMTQLQSSKTVLEFLLNIPYIDNRRTTIHLCNLLKMGKISNTDFSKLKINLTDYLDKNQFIEFCELIQEDISNNHLFNSINNIESNINDNRIELSNKLLLNYESKLSILTPNYLASPPIIYNSEEKYIFNCIKYLLLYVYENEQYLGKKRLYDNNICLYTNKSKHNILNNINKLTDEEKKYLYMKTFNNNYQIVNKNDFVGKNTLVNDDFASLIHNTVYKVNNEHIDTLYTFIKLFYDTIKISIDEAQANVFKNIIMRFYNDPINNILKFLDLYKGPFITFVESTNTPNILTNKIKISEIINEIYKNKDNVLDNLIGKLNMSNIRNVRESLISEIRKSNDILKTYDIVIPYEEIVIKDLILIINNIKKSVAYITNLSNLNIANDLKSKYKHIKKYYNQYEYDTIIDVIKSKNYNFNLSEFDENDYDYLQVIYGNILEDLNYNLTNIYSVNESISKYVILFKLQTIIINIINKLNDDSYEFAINSQLKNKFNLVEGKIQQNKVESALFTTNMVTNSNKKYLNLFKTITINVIKNINDYSTVINKLNPIKYDGDESLTYDINDFNDVNETYDDGLMGDIEEMD